MDYSLAHEQGLGGHLGAPKQAVERGNSVDKEILYFGYLFYTWKTFRIHFGMSTYPRQQE
jgi:hypothetical protein